MVEICDWNAGRCALSLDNFLDGGAIVSDDADEVYINRKLAHIDNACVVGCNYCAFVWYFDFGRNQPIVAVHLDGVWLIRYKLLKMNNKEAATLVGYGRRFSVCVP